MAMYTSLHLDPDEPCEITCTHRLNALHPEGYPVLCIGNLTISDSFTNPKVFEGDFTRHTVCGAPDRGAPGGDHIMARLWRNTPETSEGKYLVKRRDGTIPQWPWFVLGAADPAAPTALNAYARAARNHGMDDQFVRDIFELADQFEQWRDEHGTGDPDAPRHRVDDPAIVAEMQKGHGA